MVGAMLRGQRGPIRLSDASTRRGGQAMVYCGWDAAGRKVAVKVSLPGAMEQRGLRAELAALDAIQRRNPGSDRWLVPLLDQGELPDGRPFLVLPWVDLSLDRWLRVERRDLYRRLEVLILASEALIQLHRSAQSLAEVILHRDLKPANLLVDEGPDGLRVLLADLGTVKERSLHGATRNTGIHLPLYAPLDQMLPIDRAPDPSVDVHALAVTIFFGLVGREPQAVQSRTGLLTDAGLELVRLHEAGGGETEAEQALFTALQCAPLEKLVDMEHAAILPAEDLNRLREALVGLLAGEERDASALAAELTEILVPDLRRALEVDPARRLSRPEVLLAALRAAQDRLSGGSLIMRPRGALESMPPREQAIPDAVAWRGLATVVGFLLVCGVAVCLGGVTSMVRAVEDEVAAATEETATPWVSSAPVEGSSDRTPVVVRVEAPLPGELTPPTHPPSDSRHTLSRATALTTPVEASVPAMPPADQTQAPTLGPPQVVISYKADGDALVEVDGQASLHAFRGDLGAGDHPVTIRSAALEKERSFLLKIEREGERWLLRLEDPQGGADAPRFVSPGGLIKVRWSLDNRVRFEE